MSNLLRGLHLLVKKIQFKRLINLVNKLTLLFSTCEGIHAFTFLLFPVVPPINVEIEAVGSTWIALSWEQLLTSTVVSNQTIIVRGGDRDYNVTVDKSQSNANVTNLPPGTMISLSVVAVAEDGQMSFPSVAATAMTLFSGTELPCIN